MGSIISTEAPKDSSSNVSTPESEDISLYREYIGIPPPSGAHLPTVKEILQLCDNHPCSNVSYPSKSPVFWIKYGNAVYWNEVAALAMVHRELSRLKSTVRAPAVYYAFQIRFRKYIVMDYIPGKTAGEWLKEADQAGKEDILKKVAFSLAELYRIPVPIGSRPTAIDGDRIRHDLFPEEEAPRHYETVDQLEEHINLFLQITNRTARVSGLSKEPMVVCQSDIFPNNFIIDSNGRITVIDLSDVSILPSSFAQYSIQNNKFGEHMKTLESLVSIPTSEETDNNNFALRMASGRLVMGSYSFFNIGKRIPGGDQDTQDQILALADVQDCTGRY